MLTNTKALLLAFWLGISCVPSFSQKGDWYWQWPKPSGNPTVDVSFADTTYGYTSVSGGYVAFTQNSGKTWMLTEKLAVGDVSSVSSPSPFIAFCGGDAGNIVKTTDGGFHWDTVFQGLQRKIYDLHAWDEKHIWAVGQDLFFKERPYLLKSSDGGANWQEIFPPDTATLYWKRVQFFSEKRGIAMSTKSMWHTWDGGRTWPLEVPLLSTPDLVNCTFLDSTHAWAWTHGSNFPANFKPRLLWKTQDGGRTWVSHVVEHYYFHDMKFESPNVGYAPFQDGVLKTTDGGRYWAPWVNLETRPLHQNVNTTFIEIKSPAHMWVFAGHGSYFRFLNANGNFTSWPYSDKWFNAADFHGEKHAWLHTHRGIMRTTDAGSNWDFWGGPDSLHGWRSMDFINLKEGWIAGRSSHTLAHTVDSGLSWTLMPSPLDFPTNLRFLDDTLGFVMNQFGDWARTQDKGKNWKLMPRMPSWPRVEYGRAYYFSSEKTIFIGEDHITPLIMITEDGGRNWKSRKFEDEKFSLIDIDFIDQHHGFVCGRDFIYYSWDGGNSWRPVFQYKGSNPFNFRHGQWLDKNTGYYLFKELHDFKIMKTRDGGQSWEFVMMPETNFFYAIDSSRFWIMREHEVLNNFNPYKPFTQHLFDPIPDSPQVSFDKAEEILIYPNPTDQRFFIKNIYAWQSISLFNIQGKKIENRQVNQRKSISWNVANLAPGMYFFQFRRDEKVITRKVSIY